MYRTRRFETHLFRIDFDIENDIVSTSSSEKFLAGMVSVFSSSCRRAPLLWAAWRRRHGGGGMAAASPGVIEAQGGGPGGGGGLAVGPPPRPAAATQRLAEALPEAPGHEAVHYGVHAAANTRNTNQK